MDKQLSQEVVLHYRAPAPEEVVLTYRPTHTQPQSKNTHPRSKRGLWVFLGCFTALLVAITFILVWSHLTRSTNTTTQTTNEITIPIYDTQGDGTVMALTSNQSTPLTPQEIYAQVNPAVVTVLSELNGMEMAMGTGVVYSQDGYIVTNYHVIEGATSCAVAMDTGDIYQAYYVAGDEDYDLAVLKINQTGLTAATFAQSDFLTVGDAVYAIGNPLGLELRGTFTDGIVSAINRDVEVDGRTMSTLIQTNAALNSGNSGGPLINIYGQVVGINTVKMGSGSTSVEGIGFAIPSATVQRIVQDLVTVGSVQPEPILGVTIGTVATVLSDGTTGALVYEITPNSPADNAQLRSGDVLLTLGGQVVTNSDDVLRVRRSLRVGDTVAVTYWRNGVIQYGELYLDMS